ncbi:MAG: flagellar FliJ family protein [Gammaproteobacteria bacterium]|nr:flagellar FliJ family protein [Gammaproteobacteria bacterium]
MNSRERQLDVLMQLAERNATERLVALQEAQASLQRQRHDRALLVDAQTRHGDNLDAQLANGIGAGALRTISQSARTIGTGVEQIDVRIEGALRVVEERQQAWEAAQRKCDALAKFTSRRATAKRRRAARDVVRRADEVATLRSGQGSR